ncbi:hypothetical protein LIER_12261 [Lithospermum erythrorhizon]|uniref:DUF641 domain-containing protein n=1 Tax=Lithospermum erythrorhizon TaxID=34254 RepID=A0AAV3PSD7_LITER
MFPDTIFRFFKADGSRMEEQDGMKEVGLMEMNSPYTIPTKYDQHPNFSRSSTRLSLRFDDRSKMDLANNNDIVRRKGDKKTSNKVSNISELIQRVITPSCLLNNDHSRSSAEDSEDDDDEGDFQDRKINVYGRSGHGSIEKVMELEMLLSEVFEAVSNMEGAYISLQQAHCPWDGDKMRLANAGVVTELERLGMLWERYRRSGPSGGDGGKWRLEAAMVEEVVAPYEAAMEELKSEVRSKDRMIVELEEKVKMAAFVGINGGHKMGGKPSSRKVSCISQVVVAPGAELFETTMGLVVDAAKSFTAMLLSLMRSAHWDIVAAVRSIESSSFSNHSAFSTTNADFIVGSNHSKYALESFVSHKMFQDFDQDTFNMDGSLSSLLHPGQYRQECFALFEDMKDKDPLELLDILPTCSFGNFCFKKYLNIVHPKMEESLFGDMEQRRQVMNRHHPRSQFYGEFLGLAKVVWLLHLLAFSSDPPLRHFEAGRGVGFHPQYMESVVKRNPRGGVRHFNGNQVVGFPVGPGFKLADESVIKARVYLVPNK